MYGIMSSESRLDFAVARRHFQTLRRRAAVRGLLDRLKRSPSTLCVFKSAQPILQGTRQRQDVCLDDIRGSVGRAQDYTANFLPRRSFDEERWARIRVAVDSDTGVPPLELLEHDGVYYVKDGHHRVSVFKFLNVRCVEAYVTKLQVNKPTQASLSVGETSIQGRCQPCITNV